MLFINLDFVKKIYQTLPKVLKWVIFLLRRYPVIYKSFFLVLILNLILFVFEPVSSQNLYFNVLRKYRIGIMSIILTYVVFQLTKGYLENDSPYDEDTFIKSSVKGNEKEINIRSDKRNIYIDQNTNISLTDEEKEELYDKLIDSFNNTIVSKVDAKINFDKPAFRYLEVKTNFQRIQNRLTEEIKSLNRKGNINLSIGVTTTFSAILILFYANYNLKGLEFESWSDFTFFFIPKFSIAIFLEVFSFYFLAIYKSNLSEIKYYQNELNEIDFKTMMLQSYLLTDGFDIEKIGTEFFSHDKNRILNENQTTETIESIKAENAILKEFLQKIPSIKDLYPDKEQKK